MMHKFSLQIIFQLVLLLNGYEFVQPIIHASNNNYNYNNNNFTPQSYSIFSTTNNNNNNSEWLRPNRASVNSFQENLKQIPTANHKMLKHGQFEWSSDRHLDDELEKPPVRQLLARKHDWDRCNTCNVFDPQRRQLGNLQMQPSQPSSGDHLHKRHLADYNQPAPANSEMPPNLHHHLPLIVYKAATKTMSHATGNEPSPVTTQTVQPLASIKTLDAQNAIINNKFDNYYVGNAVSASRSASKQFLYAPLRSAAEKELPQAAHLLPYPPSFIYITTTEKPTAVNYNSVGDTKMPDFFTHRQFKSLWDSYVPSWQTMKFMQKFPINSHRNNLQTLAFAKDGKKKIEK